MAGNESAPHVNKSDFGGVNLSEWALRHSSFMLFLMVLATVTGLWSYARLGRSEDPPFTVKVMLVKAVWPGATITETMDTYGHLFPDAEDLGHGAIDAIFAVALTEQERNQETW